MATDPLAADVWDDEPAGPRPFAIDGVDDNRSITGLLPLLDMAAIAVREPPAREWAMKGWIPARQATYLTGPGSAGKSLLAQLLCTCVALGKPFLGVEVNQASALYVTCEDDANELERRQKDICDCLGVSRAALVGRLHLCSLQGQVDTELVNFENSGRLIITDAYRRLQATAEEVGARFIAIDNVAHLTPEEIARSKVAGFVNLLNRLALAIDGAVLFLGHPNKIGSEFSGSTAWENQVRTRLFMEEPKDTIDTDLKVLRRTKSNYARKGEEITFRWHAGCFVRDGDLPPSLSAELALTAAASTHNERFMRCLAEMTRQLRAVSEKGGKNYAPAKFAEMAEAKGSTKKDLNLAMDRLFRLGRIKRAKLWDGPDRHPVYGLRETPTSTPSTHA